MAPHARSWAALLIAALSCTCHPSRNIALGEPPEGARSVIIALRDESSGRWAAWADDLSDGVRVPAALPGIAENTALLAGYFPEPLDILRLREGALLPAGSESPTRPLPPPKWLSRARLTREPVSWELEPVAEWPESLAELRLADDRPCGEYSFVRFEVPGTLPPEDSSMDAQLAVTLDENRVLVGLGDGRLFVVTSTGIADVTHRLPFARTSSIFFPQRATGPIDGKAWLVMSQGEVVEVRPSLEMIQHTEASELAWASTALDGGVGPEGEVELYSVNGKFLPGENVEVVGRLARWTERTGWVDLQWEHPPTPRGCEPGVQDALVIWLGPGKASVIRKATTAYVFELGKVPPFKPLQLDPFQPPCTAIGHRGRQLGAMMALSSGDGGPPAEHLYRWEEDRWVHLGRSPEQLRVIFELALPDGPRLLTALEDRGSFVELLPPPPRSSTLRVCDIVLVREEDMLHTARLGDGAVLAGFSIRDTVRMERRQNVIFVRRR